MKLKGGKGLERTGGGKLSVILHIKHFNQFIMEKMKHLHSFLTALLIAVLAVSAMAAPPRKSRAKKHTRTTQTTKSQAAAPRPLVKDVTDFLVKATNGKGYMSEMMAIISGRQEEAKSEPLTRADKAYMKKSFRGVGSLNASQLSDIDQGIDQSTTLIDGLRAVLTVVK